MEYHSGCARTAAWALWEGGGAQPGQQPQAPLCCPAGAVPKVPSSKGPWGCDTWGQLHAESCIPAHSPPSIHPSSQGRKIPFGTQLPALSSACPLFHPKPCRAMDPGKDIFQGCITWIKDDMGHGDAQSSAGSASQLRVHPGASLLPLSCRPPPHFPFSKASVTSYYPPPRTIWVTLPCHYPR